MRRLSNQLQPARLVQMLGLLQRTAAELARSGNRRTDTELCLIRLCDPALDESTAALNARLSRVEELLAGGIPAACPVPERPLTRTAPAARQAQAAPEPASVRLRAEDRPPWEDETRPPLPQEPGARPAPAEEAGEASPGGAPAGGSQSPPAAPASGAGPDLWPGLVTAVRRRFPSVYPFLSNPSSVEGRLEGSMLTLWVRDEFTKSMVGAPHILEELGRLASAQTGTDVRCVAKVGAAPPVQGAPAGDTAPAGHDNLDDLLALGRQFDNIIIQE